jgi:hypothetical protein
MSLPANVIESAQTFFEVAINTMQNPFGFLSWSIRNHWQLLRYRKISVNRDAENRHKKRSAKTTKQNNNKMSSFFFPFPLLAQEISRS